MKATIIAATREFPGISRNFVKSTKEEAIEFGGKQAGICYMGESYFDSSVIDTVKAVKRFHSTAKNTHHSIIDHCKITILFEGISKMTAMILNSLQDYCTSEKSGRYTVMTGNSEVEQELYTKWMELFTSRIKEVSPTIDDKTATKLGQENARYILSVFTRSTTMSYTTSYRQWNYILDWCTNYLNHNKYSRLLNNFTSKLYADIDDLYTTLKDIDDLYIEDLRDPNNRHFSFLTRQTNDIMQHTDADQIGDMYKISYTGSFVQLAQAQRHRTLKYFMQFDGIAQNFYVPPIIVGTELENVWISDMNKVAIDIPQGTLVDIVECGYIGDFFLKCKERLCGRAQLEIMNQTCETLKRFCLAGQYSQCVEKELSNYVRRVHGDFIISTKCNLRGGCKESCMHGAKDALTRLI